MMNNQDTEQQSWRNLSRAFGCDLGSGNLDCMRNVPFEKILDEVSSGPYLFSPIPDNVTVFNDYESRAKEGRIAKLVCYPHLPECQPLTL